MSNPSYGKFVSGLADLKVTKLDGSVQEDLDAAQEMSVVIVQESATLEGDDKIKATKSKITSIQGKVTAGSVSSAALGIILGAAPSTTGTTPNRVTTITITPSTKLPYFKIYGLGEDDMTGAFQIICYKVKVSGNIEFKLASGMDQWVTPGFDFEGVENDSGDLVRFIQQETATALPNS